MDLPQYDKPQISIPEQIDLLKLDGLSFKDESKAKYTLENISLFRMKSYLMPLREIGQRKFKKHACFEDAYALYKFDSELRKIICSELEKIEVSIRTQLSLIMGDYSGIYWFEKSENFRNQSRHSGLLSSLKSELCRSDDEAIIGFQRKYSNLFPPTWITFEISSFGTLSMMYRYLRPGQARRKVARFYGLSDTVMESWLHAIVYVRNICAHHSRLWNRKLSINALIPRSPQLTFITIPKDTKRVYYVLSIILYFIQTINPKNTFALRFKQLLSRYSNVDTRAMGFPENWEEEKLWN